MVAVDVVKIMGGRLKRRGEGNYRDTRFMLNRWAPLSGCDLLMDRFLAPVDHHVNNDEYSFNMGSGVNSLFQINYWWEAITSNSPLTQGGAFECFVLLHF